MIIAGAVTMSNLAFAKLSVGNARETVMADAAIAKTIAINWSQIVAV